MATGQIDGVLQRIRRCALLQEGGEASDGQLLERIVRGGDEAAFAALVRRHARMVWGVCRRLLANVHDAEDAFQAAFLVLVRKAAAIKNRELVGNWLYGTAHRAALEARTQARRHGRERQVNAMPEPQTRPAGPTDTRLLLDQELTRLPDKYRVPVILCDLEGRTRREVARHLKLPEGTLSGRLTTAHRLLAKRLRGRGVTASGALLAAVLAQQAAAAVPAKIVSNAIEMGTLTAGQAAAGAVSANVAALARGVLRAMFIKKLSRIAVSLLILCGLAVGVMGTRTTANALAAESATLAASAAPRGRALDEPKPEKTKPGILLFAGQPSREYQFLHALLSRQERDKRCDFTTYLQSTEEKKNDDRPNKDDVKDNSDKDDANKDGADKDGAGKDGPAKPAFGKDGFAKDALDKFDVIIAIDPDWSALPRKQLKQLHEWVSDGGGLVFVAGAAYTRQLAADDKDLAVLRSLLPVKLKDSRKHFAVVKHDASEPYALEFTKLAGKIAFMKLDAESDNPLAGWMKFLWLDGKEPKDEAPPERGFHNYYPVEKVQPAAQVLATFTGPAASRIEDGQAPQPFIVLQNHGKGKTLFIGSAELWRLRAFNEGYYDRFWTELVKSMSSGRRGGKE